MAQEPAPTTTATDRSTVGDGVDPNRNYPEHWGYDNEGSSPDLADETYRGPSAGSEPETQALKGLIDRIKPKFQSNLHSFGEWLLYPQGWQVGTLDADYPLYVALGGTDANSAIPGFNPGQSADTLYVTNGETTDYAETSAGTIAYTPELGEGTPGSGFVFPDDEAADPGGVREDARLPSRPGEVRARSRGSGISCGHRRGAVLPRRGRHRPAERADVAVRLQVQRVVRRPAGGARARQPRRSAGSRSSTRSTGAGSGAPGPASGTVATATPPATPTTTTCCAARSEAPIPGTR